VVAAILAALIARHDALLAIPVSFGLWAIIGKAWPPSAPIFATPA
jgi:hypothetical protein